MATYYDDFSGSTVGASPTGWTNRWSVTHTTTVDDAGAASYLGGKAAVVTKPDNSSHFMSMDAVGSVADVEILCRQIDGTGAADYSGGVMVRASGTVSTRGGYVLRRDEGALQIYSYVSNAWGLVGSVVVPFGAPATWVWYRLRAQGSTISGKVWRCSEPEPTEWQISVTNTAVPGAGWTGVACDNTAKDPYYIDVVSVATGGDTAPLPATNSGQLRVTAAYLEVLSSNTLTTTPMASQDMMLSLN